MKSVPVISKAAAIVLTLVLVVCLEGKAEVVQAIDRSADPRSKNLDHQDSQLKQKARKKLYPGGRDEEQLRVQPQMAQPTRKMGPATEAPEPSSATSTDD